MNKSMAHKSGRPLPLQTNKGLCGVVNLAQKVTGLPFMIRTTAESKALLDIRIRARRKIAVMALASVTIRPKVHVVRGVMSGYHLALLRRWVELNRKVLIRYWERKIGPEDAIAEVRRIRAKPWTIASHFRRSGKSPLDGTDAFYWLTDLLPEKTGLPFVLYIAWNAGAEHDICLKVAPFLGPDLRRMATVEIKPRVRLIDGEVAVKDLALLRRWVELNRDLLVRHWDGDADSMELIESVKPVPGGNY